MTIATGATFRHDHGGSGENPPLELAKICSVEAKDKMNLKANISPIQTSRGIFAGSQGLNRDCSKDQNWPLSSQNSCGRTRI